MKKITVHLNALSYTSVDLEVEDHMTREEIIDLAYDEADLSSCEPANWDVGSEDVEGYPEVNESHEDKTEEMLKDIEHALKFMRAHGYHQLDESEPEFQMYSSLAKWLKN